MRSLQAVFWIGCIGLVTVTADKKEHSGKIAHDSKSGKHHHLLGHWGEHWSMVGKPTSKHETKNAMKHAPSFVSHHDANMQSDLGYKKNTHDKHKAMADLHLQDLMMEESQRHETREQKITKLRPTHSTHHRQEGHQIPKPRPTIFAAAHGNPHGRTEHHEYFHHNKPTSSSVGHKATKISQKKMKPKKTHTKEKKLDKKFPKKYNQRKHDKKMFKN